MSTLRVSVALCTRNGARYVEQQVRDILAQDHPIDELVVSDDASADDTLAIIERVFADAAPSSTRLVVLRNATPLGVTANFEQAARAATGDLIAFADQDDRWRPDRISAALSLFRDRPDLLLTHSDARLVGPDGAPLGTDLFGALEISSREIAAIHAGTAFDVLLRRNVATGATMTMRSTLLEVAVPFPPDWVHDEWLAIAAAATGEVDVIERQLVDYRQHGGNEIGATRLTIGQKIRKTVASAPDRNAIIARRFVELGSRLERAGLSEARLAQVRGKVAHENARAAMPSARWRRIPRILTGLADGGYARYASRRRWDAVRDLLRPA